MHMRKGDNITVLYEIDNPETTSKWLAEPNLNSGKDGLKVVSITFGNAIEDLKILREKIVKLLDIDEMDYDDLKDDLLDLVD